MGPYLLGIDIGTSACKVALFDQGGNVISSSSEEYEVSYPKPGWAEQNPEDWWTGICRGIKGVLEQSKIPAGQIAGIG
ncbi:MAG: FGGY family carbohydrate kinase, partial [Lacrimispora sphenoides]